MNLKRYCHSGLLLNLFFAMALCASAEELKPIALPAPQTSGGRPVMDLLKERKSSRSFSAKELSPQMLSSLLWAAFGINRPDTGGRTAPSAMNRQEIDIYVATADGVYLYDARKNELRPVVKGDIRADTGGEGFVKDAPVTLIYVADYSRMGPVPSEDRLLYSAAGAGFIGENVYLFCGSQGLSTVIRGAIDRPRLSKSMQLRGYQRILLAQSVGYPKDQHTQEH